MSNDVLLIVVVVGAFLVFAELLVRLAAPRMATLLEWRDWECHHKAAAIERLGERGGASVVMIGSSLTNAAFDPELYTRLLGLERPAFNAALNGATMRTLELWTRDVLLPKLRPALLIVGLTSSEINDNNLVGQRGFTMFSRSRGWRRLRPDPSAGQRLLLRLEDLSYLIRYRHFFREPGTWGMQVPWSLRLRRFREDPLRHLRRGRGVRSGVTPYGQLHAIRAFDDSTYQLRDHVRETWVRVLHNYAVGGPELAALRRLVRAVRASGASVLLVLTPTTDDWVDVHPRGIEDFNTFRAALDAFVAEQDVPLDEMMPGFQPPEGFADPVHRNPEGRERYTTVLARVTSGRIGSVLR